MNKNEYKKLKIYSKNHINLFKKKIFIQYNNKCYLNVNIVIIQLN